MKTITSALLFWSLSGHALALDPAPVQPDKTTRPAVVVPPPPPMPAANDQDKIAASPEATIVEKENTKFTEYRLAGKLYMIKVEPKVGPPYYLYDETGNGLQPVAGRNDAQHLSPPRWIIKTF